MEFIPLKSTPSSHKKSVNNPGSGLKKQPNASIATRRSYIGSDATLMPRIKQYLQTCKQGQGINIAAMAANLQQTYSDYRRKKKNAFKIAVTKAYDVICQEETYNKNGCSAKENNSESSDLDEDDSKFGSDFSIDNDNYTIYKDANSANNSLRNLYGNRLSKIPGATSTPLVVETLKQTSGSALAQQSMETIELQKFLLGENILANQKEGCIPESPASARNPATRKRKSTIDVDPPQKAKRKPNNEIVLQRSSTKFADLGGNDKCLEQVCWKLVDLLQPGVYPEMGARAPRGLLLHGPPGCGKTLLAHAIASELDVPFIKMAATELVSGISGESEAKIRDVFDQAVAAAPCIIFIDEIDAIATKRETAQRNMEQRIVTQLLTSFDGLNTEGISPKVMVIGATNRPDALDSALRRAGRFDCEISVGIPDVSARIGILKVLCRDCKLSPNFDFSLVAKDTPGFVGADLMALIREAANCAIKRLFHSQQISSVSELGSAPSFDATFDGDIKQCTSNPVKLVDGHNAVPLYSTLLAWLRGTSNFTEDKLSKLCIEMSDFQCALKDVQPSAMREGFATVPNTTWDDVGALHELRDELQISILAPIQHPEKCEALNLGTPAGILLYGPAGCGKTLLAKAIANESGINFISVKGPELLNMYLGESEKAIRQCFQRARNSAPCVIFFDELESLCPKRSDSMEGNASSRVVNQLLTEMDGLETRKQVFVLGATNRPDIIDPAVLRPGRFDKILYVGLPSAEDRIEILNTLTKHGTRPCFGSDVSLTDIGNDPRCNGFTGADLAALVKEASKILLKESFADDKVPLILLKKHFDVAFSHARLSVLPKDLSKYERMKAMFSSCNT